MSEAGREREGGLVPFLPSALAEAVAADWVLEFSCCCLCRYFVEECEAEFRRWRDVAQAVSNGFSKVTMHQKKMVYICQLLIRIAEGKRLECHFENDTTISPLESALSFWTLLEREESKLNTLHEEIRRLIQIQVVAVYMEKGYYKEAAEVLERLFTDSESHKPLRMKLAAIVKSKDPYVPLLQSFSYSLLLSKVKSYVKLFLKENRTNFLLQAATKQVESEGGEVRVLQNKTLNVKEERENNLEAKQRPAEELRSTTDWLTGDISSRVRPPSKKGCRTSSVQRLKNLKNVEERGDDLPCSRRRQPWTYEEDKKLKSGVREFGVGNWTKILIHGDFNNRTSVMLKDRWRTLCKIK
ncbi:telomeric repeat-binding factor 1 isoform 1 [Gallus gallus]|uniref:Telomeric repeat-binding factor n=1 Tax=Gallus gallus TaxID=9031 RepID=A0A8V0XEG3_CHICK|nr:telomeric repeat-binding factor 1 isoform 1 [Gallus gallus]